MVRRSYRIKKNKKPAPGRGRLRIAWFSRERRYANHGHLLPMLCIEQAVEPGVSALPFDSPATYRISDPAELTIGKFLTQPSEKDECSRFAMNLSVSVAANDHFERRVNVAFSSFLNDAIIRSVQALTYKSGQFVGRQARPLWDTKYRHRTGTIRR
jgi:hypothetical protein